MHIHSFEFRFLAVAEKANRHRTHDCSLVGRDPDAVVMGHRIVKIGFEDRVNPEAELGQDSRDKGCEGVPIPCPVGPYAYLIRGFHG